MRKFFLKSLVVILLLISSPCFGGVDLNGDADYIVIDDSASMDLSGVFSVSLWVNFDSVAATSWLIGKTDFGQNKRTWHFYFEPSGTDAIEFGISPDGSSTGIIFYEWQQTPSTDTWINYVVTYNKNNGATERAKLYKDGVLQSTTVNVEGNPDVYDSDIPVAIGAGRSNGTYNSFLNGEIKEVYIWDGVELSQTEATLLSDSKVKRIGHQIQPSSLVLYSSLDDFADGTDLNTDADGYKDSSGNGNHGQGVDADGDSLNIAETVLTYQ